MLQFYRAGSAGRGQAPAVASPQYMLLFLKNYLLYMLLISLQNDLVRLTNTALAQLIPQKRSVKLALRVRYAQKRRVNLHTAFDGLRFIFHRRCHTEKPDQQVE